MRLELKRKRLSEVKVSKAILSFVLVPWLSMSQLCLANETIGTVALPDWWQEAQSPEVREVGEQLSRQDDPGQRARGNLMLARHQETLGHLSRALNYAGRALAGEPDNTDRVLATYLRASMLGRMGRFEGQRKAIDEYVSALETSGPTSPRLEDPAMMRVFKLAALGETESARQRLENLGPPPDSDQLAQRLFAEAVLASAAERDPAAAWNEIEKAIRTLGVRASTKNFMLMNAASIYAGRRFKHEDAQEFAVEAIKVRPADTVFLPEAELARLNLDLCRWDRAGEWLARAQQAKMTLRPNFRQEAIKDLKFAVADFYLATGYPREARIALEGLEHDFFRPGYTTGSADYYLCGLFLRRYLALSRELSLGVDCWMRSDVGTKLRTLFPLLRLQLSLVRAKIQFRDRLVSRSAAASAGTDLATLYYGPPWLLPAMAEAVGQRNFASLAEQFRPEGKRREILEPLIQAVLGQSEITVPQAAPKLLRAITTVLADQSPRAVAAVYGEAPSAFLLAGRSLPTHAPQTVPVAGWLQRANDGLALSISVSADGSSARLELSAPSGGALRSCQTTWPRSVSGRLEKLNLATVTSVFPLDEQTVKKIEGKALQFQDAGLASN